MAYFYGRLKGHGQEVTRTGIPTSGIQSELSTIDINATTKIFVDDNGNDTVEFHLGKECIAAFTLINGKLTQQ